MKTKCIIIGQYYNENGRPKGEQRFELYVDADDLFYAPSEIMEVIFQTIIDNNWGDSAGRVEYRTHELVFHEPIQCNDNFSELLDESYKAFLENNDNQNQ